MTEIVIALIGAVAGIGAAVIGNISSNRRLAEKVDKVAVHTDENYLGLLRLTVMSEEMPVSERIIAGKKYIDAGGNGDVRRHYDEIVATHIR
nr:MAG TPA: hypothetical protein [Caudoviricetes sp.]